MKVNKSEILNKLGYTELAYERINKKLNTNLSHSEIEKVIYRVISETDEMYFISHGKNIYITSLSLNINVTINAKTFTVITADLVSKNQLDLSLFLDR